MTSKENQKVKAFQTLLNFLEENPNKTAQVEPIVVDMKDLKKALSSTLTAETQSKTQSSIVSDETSRMRKQLESATAEIAALTLSYAARVKNAVLKAKMNVSKAELGKERIPMLPNRCQEIVNEVRLNLANMIQMKYAVTEEKLGTVETLIQQFATQSPQTAMLRSKNATNTQTRVDTLKEATDIVYDRLLNTAIAFKEIDPAFYQQILSAAKIKYPRTSATRVKVILRQGMTLMPIAHKTLFIPELNKQVVTNKKGEAVIKVGRPQLLTVVAKQGDVENVLHSQIMPVRGKTTIVELAV